MSIDKGSVESLISDRGHWSNCPLWICVWDLTISNQNQPSLKTSPWLRFFRWLPTECQRKQIYTFVTLPMLKDFKVTCWQYISSMCRFIGIFLYFSVLISMGQLVNSIHCHFFNSCFENVNVFQHGWYIKEQFGWNLKFTFTYGQFGSLETLNDAGYCPQINWGWWDMQTTYMQVPQTSVCYSSSQAVWQSTPICLWCYNSPPDLR